LQRLGREYSEVDDVGGRTFLSVSNGDSTGFADRLAVDVRGRGTEADRGCGLSSVP
jgi:hypothetical protein